MVLADVLPRNAKSELSSSAATSGQAPLAQTSSLDAAQAATAAKARVTVKRAIDN